MPTLNEVWEQAVQANANLVTLHDDLGALGECCATTNRQIYELISRTDETNDWLEELRQIVNDGFTAVSHGLTGVHVRQEVMIRLLVHQAAQNETMICALEKISNNTCHLLDHAARQTNLQVQMADDMAAMRHMYATTHPDSALAHQRFLEERKKLEECCPPDRPRPACTYEPCPSPPEIDIRQLEEVQGYEGQPSKVVRRAPWEEIG